MEKQGKMAIQERPVPYRRNASLYKAGRSTKKRAVANNNGKLSKTDKRLMQFLACVFIFAVVAIVKVVFPQGAAYVKQTVFGSIVDIDYKGAVEALGRALGGGGNITEVFNHFIVHEDSKADEADKSNDDNEALQPDTNSPDEKEGIDIADDASGTISGDGISDTSEANGDSTAAQNSIDPSDLESGISRTNLISRSGTNNLPTRQEQTELTSYIEDLSFELSDADLSDDTPANPFLVNPPDRVDMETKSFNFKYTTPLYGSITSPFGYREHPIDGDTKFHYGIDIGAAMGSDIVSFADGVVDAVGVSEIYGKYIKILHSDGVLTFYGHCGKTLYKPGQKVKMGTVIARVGSTGVSTGPHLHFEVRLGDSILDPTPYINPEKE